MRRAFVIAWWGALAALWLSCAWLPEQVGDPGKQAPRALYAVLMLFVLAQAWFCSDRFILWIGHRSPDLLNLPNKAYWMDPVRRTESVERMATHVSGLGLQVLALVAGLHTQVLLKSQPDWPQPHDSVWIAGAALLAVAFMLWVWRCYRLFPAPPQAPHEPVAPRRPRRPGEHR